MSKTHLPWSPHNPNKCQACKGSGLIPREVESTFYKCGFVSVAETCSVCLGSGRKMPVAVDFKSVAAGDVLL